MGEERQIGVFPGPCFILLGVLVPVLVGQSIANLQTQTEDEIQQAKCPCLEVSTL
ncbi:hypothetical protein BJX99DRAFT_224689 [Aspergillus californicus]